MASMNKTLIGHASQCLMHPLSLFGALTLALNALVFQRYWPSWWAGKLGDLAWMVFAPFLVALVIGLLTPPSRRITVRRAGLGILIAVGLGFASVKTIAPLNHALVHSLMVLGLPLKLQLDPTDVLALPGLLVAWHVWTRERLPRPAVPLRVAAASLAALAVMADQAGPQDLGFTCLVRDGATLFAYREQWTPGGYFGRPHNELSAVYRSDDDGQTWQPDSLPEAETFICPNRQTTWPVAVPDQPDLELYFVAGRGIYHSQDGGENLSLEQRLSTVGSTLTLQPGGANLLAAGQEGVYLRTPDGNWQLTLE
jgi:hypothetical protein